MRVKLRKNCSLAEEEHQQNIRYYAHTYHYKDTICVCKAFWDLPKDHREGILLHEIGHLLAGPSGSEQDANRAAETAFGTKIEYVDSPYGKRLEKLVNKARGLGMKHLTGKVWLPLHKSYGRILKEGSGEYLVAISDERLPSPQWISAKHVEPASKANPGIEANKWIPVHAVKFNENGSVSLLGEHAANPAKLGTGARFKALTSELAAKGARTPKALAAWIGRKKYGAKKFAQLSARGRNPEFRGEDYKTLVRLPANTSQDDQFAEKLVQKIRSNGLAATYVYREDNKGRPRYDLYTNAARRQVELLLNKV